MATGETKTNGVSKQRFTSESSTESDEWNDVEDESSLQNVSCIFTNKQFPSANDYFTYLRDSENFNIWQLVLTDLNLDFFGYVKLINFLRANYKNKSPPNLTELQSEKYKWDSDEYLKPVVEDDPLLQFMIVGDDDEDTDDEIEELAIKKFIESGDASTHAMLEKERSINKNLHETLERALKQIDEMKNFMHNIILSGNVDFTRPVSACRQQNIDLKLENEEFEDSGYYGSYSHHEIHSEMLQDTVRTLTYKNAVLSNENIFKDKVVLDVGCGTGILSMFCAQAGAKHVYGVDMSEMAYQAIDIVRENGFADKITILKTTVEEAELPVEKVDIIISEWMGYFLLYESMFDSVIFARDKWLSKDGVMMPSSCSIHVIGAHDQQLYNQRVNFWSNVYGYKMPSLRKQVVSEGYIMNVKATAMVTEPSQVFNMPTKTAQASDLDFKSEFKLKVLVSGLLSTLVGYFDCHFNDLENNVMFSTSPCHQMTHWKQTIFFLNEPLKVVEGDTLSCAMYCRKNPKDPRSLIVDLKIGSTEQTFKVE